MLIDLVFLHDLDDHLQLQNNTMNIKKQTNDVFYNGVYIPSTL